MNTLEAGSLSCVLTLQEALSSLDLNREGTLFHLKIKQESAEVDERVIRMRKSEVLFDGEERIII